MHDIGTRCVIRGSIYTGTIVGYWAGYQYRVATDFTGLRGYGVRQRSFRREEDILVGEAAVEHLRELYATRDRCEEGAAFLFALDRLADDADTAERKSAEGGYHLSLDELRAKYG